MKTFLWSKLEKVTRADTGTACVDRVLWWMIKLISENMQCVYDISKYTFSLSFSVQGVQITIYFRKKHFSTNIRFWLVQYWEEGEEHLWTLGLGMLIILNCLRPVSCCQSTGFMFCFRYKANNWCRFTIGSLHVFQFLDFVFKYLFVHSF